MEIAIRILLLMPLSLLYGMVMAIRNKLFDWGILKQQSFDIPIINIGNLSMGGTGKTPHVEHIVSLFQNQYRIAILSRGYGRKTKGFIKATPENSCIEIGDEPAQYVRKFPNAIVAVCERRTKGINELKKIHPDIQLVILDDAYQHRYVKPSINILLTDYYALYAEDYVFPSGHLREFKSGSKRADFIIVTKSDPVIVPTIDRRVIKKKLQLAQHQQLFFSYIKYLEPIPLNDSSMVFPDHVTSIFMITGIVNTYPLENYIKNHCINLLQYTFHDHHHFTVQEISKLIDDFNKHLSNSKVIVTTEKDAQRLRIAPFAEMLAHLPIFYIPIKINFHNYSEHAFDEILNLKVKNSHHPCN
jgi:tetraacyldisaccharide 4'-kinase